MAGHSHWAGIKHKKAAQDKKDDTLEELTKPYQVILKMDLPVLQFEKDPDSPGTANLPWEEMDPKQQELFDPKTKKPRSYFLFQDVLTAITHLSTMEKIPESEL